MDVEDEVKQVQFIVKAASALLQGKPPQVQGAALADLLAMWLAGHLILGDPKKTKRLREGMIAEHMKTVRDLIEINYRDRIEPELRRRSN
jgi:hypothetical protein